jgi:hypothetical protein
MYAAWNGQTDRAQLLIGHGADVNARDKEGMTALMCASVDGACGSSDKGVSCVRALIAAGADVNARDDQGRTALMLAAGNGNAAMVKTLLDHGADPNINSRAGLSPLSMAARCGLTDIARTLIAHGARTDIGGNAQIDYGKMELINPAAAARDHGHEDLARLIDCKFSPSAVNAEAPIQQAGGALTQYSRTVPVAVAGGFDSRRGNFGSTVDLGQRGSLTSQVYGPTQTGQQFRRQIG